MTAVYFTIGLLILLMWFGAGVIVIAKSMSQMFMGSRHETTLERFWKTVACLPVLAALFLYSLIFERKRA